MSRLPLRSAVLSILVIAALVLLAVNQSPTLAPVRSILLAPITAIQSAIARVTGGAAALTEPAPDAEALRQRNAELEALVAQLQNRVIQLEEDNADMQTLSALLNYARTQPDNKYLAANVIGRDPSPFLSYVIIDRGSDDGLRRGMPVVSEKGLVGSVVEVTPLSAKVILIVDTASAVNARLHTSRETGVVVGQLAGGLEMQLIPQKAEVQIGDLVVTSGLGGRYPPDIVIGAVAGVERQDYEIQQTAVMAPAVDFTQLSIVLVITSFTPRDFSAFSQATATPAP